MQLASLVGQLEEMCRLAASAMESATQALLQADLTQAEKVITDREQIVALGSDARGNALAVLTLQAPVAGDLRAVVSAIQIAADIDRMGALALHIAKTVRQRHPRHALPAEVRGYFAEMGGIAVELSNSAGEVLLSRDPRKAARIRQDDEVVDGLLRRVLSVLMDREWRHGMVAAVDVTLLGRFYERFADHAVEVARAVIFQATGRTDDENWWPTTKAASCGPPRLYA